MGAVLERRRRPHAPGVWVVYFSLAALPLFGIGQVFLPAGSLAARQYAFCLLCTYTASGLGLLLATVSWACAAICGSGGRKCRWRWSISGWSSAAC